MLLLTVNDDAYIHVITAPTSLTL